MLLPFILLILVACVDISQPINDEMILSEGGTHLKETKNGSDIKEQKIISILSLDVESKHIEKDLDDIETKVDSLGGYISSHKVETPEGRSSKRKAELSIRIPSDKSINFKKYLKDKLFIVKEISSSIDVTETYYDIEANIKNLESQEAQLMELYKKADDIESILSINDKVNEVIRNKDALMREKLNIISKTEYSTFNLNIEEVSEYKTIHSLDDSSMEKIKKAITNSAMNAKNAVMSILLFLINSFPLVIVAFIGLYLYSKLFKKNRLEALTGDLGEESKSDK